MSRMKDMFFAGVAVIAAAAPAYQGSYQSNCDLRDAYKKSVDFDTSVKFDSTGTHDANLGVSLSGSYTLSSDLLTGRIFIDDPKVLDVVYDLGASRTLTVLGYRNGAVPAMNFSSSGSSFRLASGTIILPTEHEALSSTGWYQGPYPVLAAPREKDSKTRNTTFIVGGGDDPAVLQAGEIHYQYGTNNLLVVTNNGVVVVGGLGTKMGEPTGDESADAKVAAAVRNRIRVTSGGVYSNANVGVNRKFTLFGLDGSRSNAFEVVDGGVLAGWECFAVMKSAGNVFAFRGSETEQKFYSDGSGFVSTVDGTGSRFEVTDGASVELTSSSSQANGRFWLGQRVTSVSNIIFVSGAGSHFRCQSNGSIIGQYSSSFNQFKVADGAAAYLSYMIVGDSGTVAAPAKSNKLRVSSGASFADNFGTFVGRGEHSHSNAFEVCDAAIASVTRLKVGCKSTSVGNRADVSGGTLNVTSTDSAQGFELGCGGSYSVLDVRDGGAVDVKNLFRCGMDDGTVSNNVINLTGGASFSSGTFSLYGTGHAMTLSNATVAVSADVALPTGVSEDDRGLSLTFAGTNPVFRVASGADLSIGSDTDITFVVPEGGYVGPVLFAPEGTVSIGGDSGVPELRIAVPEGRGEMCRCVLAQGASLQIADEVIERARARLPGNCSLNVSATRLTLTMNPRGLCIRLR